MNYVAFLIIVGVAVLAVLIVEHRRGKKESKAALVVDVVAKPLSDLDEWVRLDVRAEVRRLSDACFELRIAESEVNGPVTRLRVHTLVIDVTTARWVREVLSQALDPKAVEASAEAEASAKGTE